MKWDRRGQVAILDALVFLAAASVVSAGLIGSLAPSEESSHQETQSFVERAHKVFLRMTPNPEELASLCLETGKNKTITVFEIIVLGLISAERTGNTCMSDPLNDYLSNVLDDLLAPGLWYSWRAEHDSTALSIPDSEQAVQNHGSRYVSTIVSKMPTHKGDVIMTLTAWRVLQ